VDGFFAGVEVRTVEIQLALLTLFLKRWTLKINMTYKKGRTKNVWSSS